jgi:hypothetical protein
LDRDRGDGGDVGFARLQDEIPPDGGPRQASDAHDPYSDEFARHDALFSSKVRTAFPGPDWRMLPFILTGDPPVWQLPRTPDVPARSHVIIPVS